MARLKKGNRRRKNKQLQRRRFERYKYLGDYSNTFSKGYMYWFQGFNERATRHALYYSPLRPRRWTPRNHKDYYGMGRLRYAGWVVMEHTKYYRRLFRERNPNRWKAYD